MISKVFGGIPRAAAGRDVVVAAANARHEGAASDCVEGLGQRRKENGTEVEKNHPENCSRYAM